MTETQNRVHAGVPSGGQFAATSHTEPGVALTGGVLPGSCVQHGKAIATRAYANGSEGEVRSLTTTPEFDTQLRTYLGVDDPEAPVSLSIEHVYEEDDEGQAYTASCGGREITFEVLSSFLERMGTAVATGTRPQGKPVTGYRLFELAAQDAAAGARTKEIYPATPDETARLLENRDGLPDGDVLHLEINHETTPRAGLDGCVELNGTADGRPLIIHTGTTNRPFRIASGHVVLWANSAAGNDLVVDAGARATIISSPDSHMTIHVNDGGSALYRSEGTPHRLHAFTRGTGRLDVQYGASAPRPYTADR